VNKKELKIFQSIDYPSIILLILLWIFFSYLKERYSRFSSQIINEIYLLNLRKIFTICILVTSFLFILKAMGINLYLNTKNLPLLLLILTTLSLSQEIFVINIFLFLFPQKYKNIFILGSENDLHQIRDILKNYKYERKLKFKIINYDYDYESNLIPDQLIITKENKMIQNESKLLKNFIFCGVQITSKYKWFENELKCIPVELIVKENFLNSEILFNDKNFQFKLKRIFDIILSFLLLIITFPIILFSGLLIWISDRGPILYRQEREGLFKKKFNIYKLRSMIVNAESSGPQWASKNDKRITLVGNILRRTRIDELPQLISVLKGDMSLIGPRPERPEFNKLLEKEIPFYNLRHLLKPGLSGWAQVNYTYSSTLSESKNKLSYDLFYISNFSIFLDFLILFKTMRIVFSGKGL
tara:strand:- start:4448 stop:5689 length:1242 start_codon:yes stop_codon:yes gene_type:complete